MDNIETRHSSGCLVCIWMQEVSDLAQDCERRRTSISTGASFALIKKEFSFAREQEKAVHVRNKSLFIAIAIALAAAGSGVLAGCSRTTIRLQSDGSPTGVTSASTRSAAESAAKETSVPSAKALGKMIYETDNDNLGHITTMYGISSIKLNACRNCHGSDARGSGKLRTPDIRGFVLQPRYNQTTFARVLTLGLDANGKRLNRRMPLFYVTPAPEDSPALWLYLNALH